MSSHTIFVNDSYFSSFVGEIMYTLFKKETRTISEGKSKKISLTPMPSGVGVREVFAELFN